MRGASLSRFTHFDKPFICMWKAHTRDELGFNALPLLEFPCRCSFLYEKSGFNELPARFGKLATIFRTGFHLSFLSFIQSCSSSLTLTTS